MFYILINQTHKEMKIKYTIIIIRKENKIKRNKSNDKILYNTKGNDYMHMSLLERLAKAPY